jgi:hypothetical protein
MLYNKKPFQPFTSYPNQVSTELNLANTNFEIISNAFVDSDIENKPIKRSVYVNNTPPNTPEKGMLWLDTSTNPATLKMFDGNDWTCLIVSGCSDEYLYNLIKNSPNNPCRNYSCRYFGTRPYYTFYENVGRDDITTPSDQLTRKGLMGLWGSGSTSFTINPVCGVGKGGALTFVASHSAANGDDKLKYPYSYMAEFYAYALEPTYVAALLKYINSNMYVYLNGQPIFSFTKYFDYTTTNNTPIAFSIPIQSGMNKIQIVGNNQNGLNKYSYLYPYPNYFCFFGIDIDFIIDFRKMFFVDLMYNYVYIYQDKITTTSQLYSGSYDAIPR